MAGPNPAMTGMSELHTPTIAKPQTPRDAFVGLNLFGWSGGLAALVIGLVVSFLLFGHFVIYYRNADMDFMVIDRKSVV